MYTEEFFRGLSRGPRVKEPDTLILRQRVLGSPSALSWLSHIAHSQSARSRRIKERNDRDVKKRANQSWRSFHTDRSRSRKTITQDFFQLEVKLVCSTPPPPSPLLPTTHSRSLAPPRTEFYRSFKSVTLGVSPWRTESSESQSVSTRALLRDHPPLQFFFTIRSSLLG